MSDTSQGPGWWQASDGKWYAPELYPADWPKPNPNPVSEAQPAAADPGPVAASAQAAEAALADPVVGQPPTAQAPMVDHAPPADATAQVPISSPPVAEASPPIAPQQAPQPSAYEQPAQPAEASAPPVVAPDGWSAADPAAVAPTGVQPQVAGGAPDPTLAQPAPAPQVAAQPASVWDQPGAQPHHHVPQPAPAMPVARAGAAHAAADTPAAAIGMVGAVLLVVGSFMAWAIAGGTLEGGGDVNGLTGSNGWGTLVCGLVVAAGAVLMFSGRRQAWVGGLVLAAALVALGLVVFSIVDIGATSDDLPGVLRDAGVDDATAAGASLDLDLGMWITTAGAGVALLAGILSLARRV